MKFYNYKVIEKLYYSDIVEEKETSTQYKQLLHKYNKLYNKIEDKELKKKLNQLNEMKNKLEENSNKEAFKNGFSLATRLILEALNIK